MRLVSAAAEDLAGEKQVDIADAVDMEALAEATQGDTIDVSQPQSLNLSMTGADARGSMALMKLWPWMLLLALLVYLAELTWRRWPRT